MLYFKKIVPVLIIIILLLPSCNNNNNETEIRALVYKWNEIHNTHNTIEFIDLYASRVLFYGRETGLDSCYAKKSRFLNSSFQQEIISPITITYYSSGTIKCDFTKQTKLKSKINQHVSYLLVKKFRDTYRITGESDSVTDQNKGVQLNLGEEVVSPTGKIYRILLIVVIGLVAVWLLIKLKRNNSQPFKKTKLPFAKNKINTDESQKGYAFEKYIVERFDETYFTLLDWRGDKFHNGKYAISSTLPDLEYELKTNRHQVKFAVECKWRQRFFDYKIEWAKQYQLDNYINYQTEKGIPVFVIIGLGGFPENPEYLYIVPLHKIFGPVLSEYELRPYLRYRKENFFLNPETMTLE